MVCSHQDSNKKCVPSHSLFPPAKGGRLSGFSLSVGFCGTCGNQDTCFPFGTLLVASPVVVTAPGRVSSPVRCVAGMRSSCVQWCPGLLTFWVLLTSAGSVVTESPGSISQSLCYSTVSTYVSPCGLLPSSWVSGPVGCMQRCSCLCSSRFLGSHFCCFFF